MIDEPTVGIVIPGQIVLTGLGKQNEQSMKLKCRCSVFSWFLPQGPALALADDRL